ncbi:MAG: alpha-glucosidase, partial [Frankiaceae bacterium]|nr:alpha-glucosidase [Frankiaceae bacterium]
AFAFVLNLGDKPVALPQHDAVLLTSIPLVDGLLPSDAAAWLSVGSQH